MPTTVHTLEVCVALDIWVNETNSFGIRWKGGRERAPRKLAVMGAILSTVAYEYTWGRS